MAADAKKKQTEHQSAIMKMQIEINETKLALDNQTDQLNSQLQEAKQEHQKNMLALQKQMALQSAEIVKLGSQVKDEQQRGTE